MDSEVFDDVVESMEMPGGYFGFDRFSSASDAADAFQIFPDWSDVKLRGEFDTLQLEDNWYVRCSEGGKGLELEPLTKSNPEFGTGNRPQLKTDSPIKLDALEISDD